jgi:hypothetical protein
MSTSGRKVILKGYRIGKGGRTVERDPKRLDASKQAKLKGGKQKMTYGKRGSK